MNSKERRKVKKTLNAVWMEGRTTPSDYIAIWSVDVCYYYFDFWFLKIRYTFVCCVYSLRRPKSDIYFIFDFSVTILSSSRIFMIQFSTEMRNQNKFRRIQSRYMGTHENVAANRFGANYVECIKNCIHSSKCHNINDGFETRLENFGKHYFKKWKENQINKPIEMKPPTENNCYVLYSCVCLPDGLICVIRWISTEPPDRKSIYFSLSLKNT